MVIHFDDNMGEPLCGCVSGKGVQLQVTGLVVEVTCLTCKKLIRRRAEGAKKKGKMTGEELERKRANDREYYEMNRGSRLAYQADYYKKNRVKELKRHAEIREKRRVAEKEAEHEVLRERVEGKRARGRADYEKNREKRIETSMKNYHKGREKRRKNNG